MCYTLIVLFAIVAFLSYIEKYMGRYRLPMYIFMGLLLIFLAGFREIGFDPDSENYEFIYRNYYSNAVDAFVEYSFLMFSAIFNSISDDVHTIFLFYALIAITMKLTAIYRLSPQMVFLPLAIYLTFYYEIHEMTQIRTGVLSGFFLFAIMAKADGNTRKAFLLLLAGTFFHTSGLALLPLLFINNEPLTRRSRIFWSLVIPIGYCIGILANQIIVSLDIPYIGEKITGYQNNDEKGQGVVNVNMFSPLQILSVLTFYYLMYFHDTITAVNKYFPILIKLFAIGIAVFAGVSFLPVVADRIGYQYQLVNIILYANIYYTVRPIWAARAIVLMVGFIYLNYTLPYLFKFNLLFQGSE